MGGTETRRRRGTLSVRVTPEEKDALTQNAARAGLPVGAYARQVLLNVPPPRQLRRPQAEFRDIAKMLAEVGKIGSNVNQIARKLNSGESPERTAITDAARAVISIRDRLLSAMGRQP